MHRRSACALSVHRTSPCPACGAGDGAGILVAMPHLFFSEVAAKEAGISLPPQARSCVGVRACGGGLGGAGAAGAAWLCCRPRRSLALGADRSPRAEPGRPTATPPPPSTQGDYAVGQVFLPTDPIQHEAAKKAIAQVGADLLGRRALLFVAPVSKPFVRPPKAAIAELGGWVRGWAQSSGANTGGLRDAPAWLTGAPATRASPPSQVAANQGHEVLGWRRVPTDNRRGGLRASAAQRSAAQGGLCESGPARVQHTGVRGIVASRPRASSLALGNSAARWAPPPSRPSRWWSSSSCCARWRTTRRSCRWSARSAGCGGARRRVAAAAAGAAWG